MKPGKPDRFERIVNNQCGFECVSGNEFWVSREVAAELLRNEHAWMRKMVRRCLKGATDTGYVIACSNILGQLTQRRK